MTKRFLWQTVEQSILSLQCATSKGCKNKLGWNTKSPKDILQPSHNHFPKPFHSHSGLFLQNENGTKMVFFRCFWMIEPVTLVQSKAISKPFRGILVNVPVFTQALFLGMAQKRCFCSTSLIDLAMTLNQIKAIPELMDSNNFRMAFQNGKRMAWEWTCNIWIPGLGEECLHLPLRMEFWTPKERWKNSG